MLALEFELETDGHPVEILLPQSQGDAQYGETGFVAGRRFGLTARKAHIFLNS